MLLGLAVAQCRSIASLKNSLLFSLLPGNFVMQILTPTFRPFVSCAVLSTTKVPNDLIFQNSLLFIVIAVSRELCLAEG